MSKNNDKNANQKTTKSVVGSFSSLENKPENDFELVLARLKAVFDVETDTDLAKKLDLKQGSISTAKQKKSVPPTWITAVALKHGISADWLLTGEGEMRRGLKFKPAALPNQDMDPTVGSGGFFDQAASRLAAQSRNAGSANNGSDFGLGDVENFDMGEVLAQTIDILNSKTVFTTAIVSNIKAFHKAITTEKKIEDMQEQLSQALASFSSFQGQLDKTNQIVSKLQSENEKLRQELEQTRAGSTLSDTG